MTDPYQDKYVVFKSKEFDEWFDTIHDMDSVRCPENIEDATVIRLQDIFAAPALHAYANSIQVALTILNGSPTAPKDMRESLQTLADFFHMRAEKAEHTDYRKLPD